MTRSQTVLVAAGVVLLGCIAGALLLRSQYAAISRHDMLGVVPGMTRDQLEKLITARRWVCAAAADGASVGCNTEAGPFTVTFAPGPGVTPVGRAQVSLADPERLSIDAMAQDISAQYGRQPQRISPTKFRWALVGGLSLTLEQTDALVLNLLDEADTASPTPR